MLQRNEATTPLINWTAIRDAPTPHGTGAVYCMRLATHPSTNKTPVPLAASGCSGMLLPTLTEHQPDGSPTPNTHYSPPLCRPNTSMSLLMMSPCRCLHSSGQNMSRL